MAVQGNLEQKGINKVDIASEIFGYYAPVVNRFFNETEIFY